MTKTATPLCIGLPVYNGEEYLEQAIATVLAQEYTDFELFISDNASTDTTPDICSDYAARDPRVRVVRHPENIGAALNFNYIFEHNSSPFFKWQACDDLLEPNYCSRTMPLLEQRPTASLAHSQTVVFTDSGTELETFDPSFAMPEDDRVERMRQVFLHGQRCYEVFGIIRRSMLADTDLIGNYRGGDNTLLYRLALLGPFAIVREPLFRLRRHEAQSTSLLADTQAYHEWFTGKRYKFTFPDWRYLRATWAAPNGVPMTMTERARCTKALLGETYRRRRRLIQNLRVAAETAVFGSSNPERRRRLFSRRS